MVLCCGFSRDESCMPYTAPFVKGSFTNRLWLRKSMTFYIADENHLSTLLSSVMLLMVLRGENESANVVVMFINWMCHGCLMRKYSSNLKELLLKKLMR